MITALPSLDSLRQQMELVQMGLTLLIEQARRIQDLDRRGEPLDIAAYAADVETRTQHLWDEGRAICREMNRHVAARYGKDGNR